MKRLLFAVVAGFLVAAPAKAATITLNFEGVGETYVGGFYGPGITFDAMVGAQGVIEQNAGTGGTGAFSDGPSHETAMGFYDFNGGYMDVTGLYATGAVSGFDTGFSFYYASPDYGGSVAVFDGTQGTGNQLGSTVTLLKNGSQLVGPSLEQGQPDHTGCLAATGTPATSNHDAGYTDYYSCWNHVSVSFAGVAQSVLFYGNVAPGFILFDNISFADHGGPAEVPEPASLVLLGTGLFVGYRQLRRKNA